MDNALDFVLVIQNANQIIARFSIGLTLVAGGHQVTDMLAPFRHGLENEFRIVTQSADEPSRLLASLFVDLVKPLNK